MKLAPKPCHFCGQEYQPKANNQLCCYKVGCRIKAREREKSLEKSRRRQRNYQRAKRDRLVAVMADSKPVYPPGTRPCLKCGSPLTLKRHICDNCKKVNQDIYQGVW